MLAFHAPPEAVSKPVIRYGKIPGRIRLRQRSNPREGIRCIARQSHRIPRDLDLGCKRTKPRLRDAYDSIEESQTRGKDESVRQARPRSPGRIDHGPPESRARMRRGRLIIQDSAVKSRRLRRYCRLRKVARWRSRNRRFQRSVPVESRLELTLDFALTKVFVQNIAEEFILDGVVGLGAKNAVDLAED